MKVKWLLEPDLFSDDIEIIANALKRQNIEYKIYKYIPYGSNDEYLKLFNEEDCVVFRGSLGFANQIRRLAKWIPGIYYDKDKYDCTSYYPALGEHLLANNYIMLPYGELVRKKEYLYDILGSNNAIFIRPNSGGKSFVGQVVLKEHFDKDISFFNIPNESLVVVSEPRNIVKEWRFVIANGKVITGSSYTDGMPIFKGFGACLKELNIDMKACNTYKVEQEGEHLRVVDDSDKDDFVPVEALDLAKWAAEKYNPDKVWIVDICQTKHTIDANTNGAVHILEIGAFSCAGLYKCNLDVVVKVVSEIALQEWQEFHDLE